MQGQKSLASILARWLPPALKEVFSRTSTPNLLGDRDIEWSWVCANIPDGHGNALDFGPGPSHLGLVAAQRGYSVTAVDLVPCQWHFTHNELKFVQGDLLKIELPRNHFDLIINCSTVEHVGLTGRYGTEQGLANGDLGAMIKLRSLLKPEGIMIFTIPIGKDAVYKPLHRVYGKERLPDLLAGYHVEKEQYWVKNKENQWCSAEKDTALSYQSVAGSWNPLRNVYALGCFVLKLD